MTNIDTGDSVHHAPTGEKWLVAYVEGDRLAWVGWPFGEAELSDCTLTRKATPEQRHQLLLDLANGNDARATYARNRLSEENTP